MFPFRRRSISTLVALAVAAALVPVSATGALADEWSRSFEVKTLADVVISADDANVRVTTWDRSEVSVQVVTQRGIHIGNNGIRVSTGQEGDRIRVEVTRERPRFVINVSWRDPEVEVRMPARGRLDIDTNDGSVTVEALEGPIDARTGDGNIHVRNSAGEITLRTGDGNVSVETSRGSLKAHTGDGRVRVDGRFAELDLSSGDGSIEVSAKTGSTARNGWQIRTGDGHLTLRVPAGFAADVDAHTNDGRISFDVPVSGKLSKRSIRGQMNGGGGLVRLRSGDGSIRLEHI